MAPGRHAVGAAIDQRRRVTARKVGDIQASRANMWRGERLALPKRTARADKHEAVARRIPWASGGWMPTVRVCDISWGCAWKLDERAYAMPRDVHQLPATCVLHQNTSTGW